MQVVVEQLDIKRSKSSFPQDKAFILEQVNLLLLHLISVYGHIHHDRVQCVSKFNEVWIMQYMGTACAQPLSLHEGATKLSVGPLDLMIQI